MATNTLFNNFANKTEQNLYNDLNIEAIQIYGVDCYYIPRVINNEDPIWKEDAVSTYEQALRLELYVKNIEGFSGQGDFLSKFGLEIRDQIIFTMSRKRFEESVQRYTDLIRPFEGDLVYFPFNKKMFIVRFVEHEDVFYQLGKLLTWDIHCELFEYSGEVFKTGYKDIDCIAEKLSTSGSNYYIKTEDDFIITDEYGYPILQDFKEEDINPMYENATFENEANDIIVWGEGNPFSDGF